MSGSLFHVGVLCVKLIWVLFPGFVYANGSILNREYFKYLQVLKKGQMLKMCFNRWTKQRWPYNPHLPRNLLYILSRIFLRHANELHMSPVIALRVTTMWFLGSSGEQHGPLVTAVCSHMSGSPQDLHGNHFYRPGLIKMSHPLYQYRGRVLSKLNIN